MYMAIAKTIEVIASSTESSDAAVLTGIAKVSETVTGIESAWVKDTKVRVEGDRVIEWRVTLAVTFIVN